MFELYSQKGKHVAVGLQDGRVRIYLLGERLADKNDLSKIGAHWTAVFHDSEYGDVTGLTFSTDGTYLLSTGLDGNFFSFTLSDLKGYDLPKPDKGKLPDSTVC